MSKFLVIVSTSEKEKSLLGIRCAIAALKNKWVDDVEVVFFGPIEKSIAEGDTEFLALIEELKGMGKEPTACIRVAEAGGYLQDLSAKGVKTGPVGEMIAEFVGKGFVPLVF